MTENEAPTPAEILKSILEGLSGADASVRLEAIEKLHSINYSSEAIYIELERLAIHDDLEEVRKRALEALDLATHKHVRGRVNRLNAGDRTVLVEEIGEWESLGLLDLTRAAVLRRRYDFDKRAKVTADSVMSEKPATVEKTEPAPKAEPAPAEPRPTLMQTLLSETSIKIALYLGAFFVVASAAILAAVSPELRLFVLIVASLGFGGLSLGIRKRLPQPSFALFIVFSFLLPITANVLQDTLGLTDVVKAVYWVVISLGMAVLWGGSIWLYESRVFSVMSFLAFVLAFYRIGEVFEAEGEVYGLLMGAATLTGLGLVWVLKKWRDDKFALPLFLSTLAVQALILGGTLVLFAIQLFDGNDSALWNLASMLTWGLAFIFLVLADVLFPFVFFAWFAALALVPIPWFLGAAFDMEFNGLAILFFVWGLILSVFSEAGFRLEWTRKFSLPVAMVAIPAFVLALINAFSEGVSLGFGIALGTTLVYAVLQLLRGREWVWALALLNFFIAYFAFFNLPLIEPLKVYFGYQALGLSLLLMLPGLFGKNDLRTASTWKLPTLAFGVIFTLAATVVFVIGENSLHTMVGFGVLAVFFTAYALVQGSAFYGYLPASFLALSALFGVEYLDKDWWLPVLTTLAVLYYAFGAALLSRAGWSRMLRNSGLVLGTLIVVAAAAQMKGAGGWYAMVVGLIFAVEMYLSGEGLLEIAPPIFFSAGVILVQRSIPTPMGGTHQYLVHSLVWLGWDLLMHLTFKQARPLSWLVRGGGALVTVMNYLILMDVGSAKAGALDFGIYTLLFLTVNLVYRRPILFHTFGVTLPLFVMFVFRLVGVEKWIHPVIFVAMGFYAVGFALRWMKLEWAKDWDKALILEGLGWGMVISIAAPTLGGLDASIPVAFAATLWAAEAFALRDVRLGFPANGLYLLAYFIILNELNVDQPQFYSMGAAALGMFQHYLLTRSGSKTGTFVMGMLSQLTLLGTTYIQMVDSEKLIYFVVLFFQSIAVLVYGLVIRSRSLTFTPIVLVVLGVVTVLYTALKGLNAVVLIGCTGVILLGLGIAAVLLRERIARLGERLSDWRA